MNLETPSSKERQLSAEAKSFIPNNFKVQGEQGGGEDVPNLAELGDRTGQVQYSRLPRYATTCYPFMAMHPDDHLKPRLSATWQGPGRPNFHYNSDPAIRPDNAYLSENRRASSKVYPSIQNRQSNHPVLAPYAHRDYQDTHLFDRSQTGPPHPPGLTFVDMPVPVPVPVQTVQSGPGVWMVNQGMLMPVENNSFVSTLPLAPVQRPFTSNSHPHAKQTKSTGLCSNQVSVGIQYELNDQEAEEKRKPVVPKRTIICKDCETQTDFSTSVANENLRTLPSPLFDESLQSRPRGVNSADSEEPTTTERGCDINPSRCPEGFLMPVGSYPQGLNSQQWISDGDPLPFTEESCSYSYFLDSNSNAFEDDLTYQVHQDLAHRVNFVHYAPGYKLLPPSALQFPSSHSYGLHWNPVDHVATNQSYFDSELTQVRSRKHGTHRTKRRHHTATSAGSDVGCSRTSSIGTDAFTRGLQEVEEEFPKLLIAAGGLPSPCAGNLTPLVDEVHERPANLLDHSDRICVDSSYIHPTRMLPFVREGLSKSAKKKQKRIEQLSRAADEELAEISLEQQVLREISSGQRQLMPPVDELLSPTTSLCNSEIPCRSSNSFSTESLESGELSLHSADLAVLAKADTEMRLEIDSSQNLNESNESNNLQKTTHEEIEGKQEHASVDRTITQDLSMHTQGFAVSNIRLISTDLSISTSSKASSMDTGSRGTSASADMSPISQTSPLSMSSPTASPFGSGVTSPRNEVVDLSKSSIISRIHSPRFREYCNQVLSREIDECCTELLQRLVRFQDRYYRDDSSAGMSMVKRRTVLGLREVAKHLKQSNLRCVIISPNMERIESKGGLDVALRNIIKLCEERQVLFVFALGRHALGRACAKLVPVSVVGIFSCDGAEEHFHRLQKLTREARSAYLRMVTSLLRASNGSGPVDTIGLAVNTWHSRTPSGCSVLSFNSSILSETISETEPDETEQSIAILTTGSEDGSVSVLQGDVSVSDVSSHVSNSCGNDSDKTHQPGDELRVTNGQKCDYEIDLENKAAIHQGSSIAPDCQNTCDISVATPVGSGLLPESNNAKDLPISIGNGYYGKSECAKISTKCLPLSSCVDCVDHRLAFDKIESWISVASSPTALTNDQLAAADSIARKTLPVCDNVS